MKISNILPFKNFYQTISKKELPIKTAYKLSKLFKAINENLDFYQEKFTALVQEYGLRDENNNLVQEGDSIKIMPEKEEECTKKLMELNNLEVDVPNIRFTLDEFANINIAVEDMLILEQFIDE